eukprot:355996-Chlamydomonas_euryale.AAC.1
MRKPSKGRTGTAQAADRFLEASGGYPQRCRLIRQCISCARSPTDPSQIRLGWLVLDPLLHAPLRFVSIGEGTFSTPSARPSERTGGMCGWCKSQVWSGAASATATMPGQHARPAVGVSHRSFGACRALVHHSLL